MMRNLGGAVGIAICGAVLNDRTNLHFERIASHLTLANDAMNRFLNGAADRYGALPGAVESGHAAALRALWQLAYREASTLAYADAFYVLMFACFAAAIAAPLMKKVQQAAPATSSAH
jgi:DHA2 family multidrug resistance protein